MVLQSGEQLALVKVWKEIGGIEPRRLQLACCMTLLPV